ncbi:MAG: PilT/PilU family type 4a pilus ATPase [Myxococcota bacterium]|nr:PilT/PilU family type 4a pilus ATPase [Myxococcota bacterium]
MELAEICRKALGEGASDIHLKADKPPVIRVNGRLRPLAGAAKLSGQDVGKLAWSVLNPAQRERFKSNSDLDIAWTSPQGNRFRINVFKQRQHVGLALRAIPAVIPELCDLHLPAVLNRIALAPRGLVLLTGVTGSGKSTTLAAMVQEINHNLPHHILTIEDPIEFRFKDDLCLINQREIGDDSASFSVALRSALRQDPDVILISEIRDAETMRTALSAAETGHLVMASLHALNAQEAITRVLDFFDEAHQQSVRNMLASSLKAIISQRLVPAKAGGRLAAVEVMVNAGAITECIGREERSKEITDLLASGSAQYGTQTFDQSLYWHYKDDLISAQDAQRFANNPEDLALRISGISTCDWNRPPNP